MMEHHARKTLADKEMFDDIVKAILSVVGDDAVKIILYGSVARGDNTWESDVDIAMLLNEPLDHNTDRLLTKAVVKVDLKYDTVVSVIDIDADHFMKCRNTLPFYANIEKEGIILWTNEAA